VGNEREPPYTSADMACIIGLVRPGWEWKARGRTKDIALYKSPGPGCSTLLDMAIRTACLNINDMTAETLRGVEWQIGKQLWKKLVAKYVTPSLP